MRLSRQPFGLLACPSTESTAVVQRGEFVDYSCALRLVDGLQGDGSQERKHCEKTLYRCEMVSERRVPQFPLKRVQPDDYMGNPRVIGTTFDRSAIVYESGADMGLDLENVTT